MNVLCPAIPGGWGDQVSVTWAAEYIKSIFPDCKIYDANRGFTTGTSIINGGIKEPWIDGHHTELQPENIDCVLFTLHRHGIDDSYYAPYLTHKKIFFDAHSMYLKFIKENWYPSFIPDDLMKSKFESLNLPQEYDVIHYAHNSLRNEHSPEEWRQKYPKLFRCENLISTGTKFDGVRDLSDCDGWLKLWIMINAKNLYVSHSGFTSMASMYRKRINTFLLDMNKRPMERNHSDSYYCLYWAPPIQSYGNVDVDYDQNKAFYFMENMAIIDYYKYCRSMYVTYNGRNCHNHLYPMFYGDDKYYSPLSYTPSKFYFDQENAPVTDLRTTIHEVDLS